MTSRAKCSSHREFLKESSELAMDLERSAPNMKAMEQYNAVQEKEKEQVDMP